MIGPWTGEALLKWAIPARALSRQISESSFS